jgi:CheY-like chemotaxis protein
MKKTILYIEDDATNAFVMVKLLERNYDMIHKEDGETGLQLLATDKVDLVLMDINLGRGKMDGTETMKRIKADTVLHKLPVIAVTSYALPEDEGRFRSQGFDDYIPKPVDRNTLLTHIEKFLP